MMNERQGKIQIWVFIEQQENCITEVSYELLQAAGLLKQKLGHSEIVAIFLGYKLKDLLSSLSPYGVDKILLADHPCLENYLTLPYTKVVSQLVLTKRPEVFLLPATTVGTDLAARVAARVHTGLSAHCTQLDIDEKGKLKQVVPAFGGQVMATIICPHHFPQMATVRPGVYRRASKAEKLPVIEKVAVDLDSQDFRQKIIKIERAQGRGCSLEEAEIVVAGGAGIGNREDWQLIEQLAEVLQGAVGGTRPPLDEGWIREDQMIGQSGKTVRPKLYIGVGISGVIQHVVGIQEAKTIIAINNDPKAAIFQTADLGIVADFHQILPKLIAALMKKT
ncbi:MAG: electron transfer flavoprotein subunit alpha/FixB family protein [Thermodesulfobacteriota bacterium]